jgi:vancomycin aglycone glucosyltransferase
VRVLSSTYDSRGGVEPLVTLAVRLRELGAEALVVGADGAAVAARLLAELVA